MNDVLWYKKVLGMDKFTKILQSVLYSPSGIVLM
jgi:hypothetical protein